MSWQTSRADELTPAAILAWREAHGWDRTAVSTALGVNANLIGMNERGERRPSIRLAAYIAAHPAPPAVQRYPATIDGLHAAIRAGWPTKRAWCQWWGISYAALHRWQTGACLVELPLSVRAWLRAGAPRQWARQPAPPLSPAASLPRDQQAARFRAWRLGTGYRRITIARLFGVNRQTIANWESGRHPVPPRVLAYLRQEGAVPAVRTARQPIQHHEPLCVPGTCRSCGMRRRWQRMPVTPRRNWWTEEQDARLRQLVGTYSMTQIAAMLSVEFDVSRTLDSIRSRVSELGISGEWEAFTAPTIARICGVSEDVVHNWILAGGLEAIQERRGTFYRITPEAFEAFLRAYPHWVNWRRMPVPQQPWRAAERRWRDLAEAVWRKDPWYTSDEAARWLGYVPSMVTKLCQRGQLRAQRGPFGHGWRIPRSSLVAFEQTQQRRHHARQSA